MAAAVPTPSPFLASTRRFGFAPRLRSLLPAAAMSSAAVSASALSPSSGTGEEPQAAPLPHSTLEIAGARRGLLSGFASLRAPYRAFPILASNRHVETIFAAFARSLPAVKLRRECLRAPDDGAIALDWVSGDDRALPTDAPVLMLLPGLTGGSDDTYVRHMLLRARSKGWRVVVFNSRGCADSPVTTPKFYSASFTGDLRQVIGHILGRYPQSNVYAAGWSLGANILVRYLGEETDKCPLSGAVSLCNPFNLVIADEDFHKGFNNVYDRALARALTTIFKKHALLFEGLEGEYDIPKAANARTVRDFDEGLTRVSFGFKSVDDYYSNSSSSDSIKNVCIPLLCIQADNDPIAPSRGIPRDDIKVHAQHTRSPRQWTACTTVQATSILYMRFASQDTWYDLTLLPMTKQIMILHLQTDQVRVPSEVPMGERSTYPKAETERKARRKPSGTRKSSVHAPRR